MKILFVLKRLLSELERLLLAPFLCFCVFFISAAIFQEIFLCFLFSVLLLLCFIAIKTKISFIKDTLLIVSSCVLCVFAFEFYLMVAGKDYYSGVVSGYSHDYYQGRPYRGLGYGPTPDTKTIAYKKYKDTDEIIYKVEYTIDEHGLRKVPRDSSAPASEAYMFFGCPQTFGEGVEDNQNTPYNFSKNTDFKYEILNFGFHGYGPHQMLRALETDFVDNVVGELKVKHAFHIAYLAHIPRFLGQSPWDPTGPKYELDKEGHAKYTGPFNDKNWSIWSLAMLSRTYKVYIKPNPFFNDQDLDLWAAILKSSERILQKKYNSGLTVIFYDGENKANERIIEKFKDQEINIVLMSDIFPMEELKEKYQIPGDGHLNALAHQKIGAYLAAQEAVE